MSPDAKEITLMLERARGGNQEVVSQLVPLLYDELRRLASYYLKRERPDHTLQATALVNEAYLRLLGQEVDWKNRSHFFGIAAQQMRRILVDYARERNAEKRGGGRINVSLDEVQPAVHQEAAEIVALHEALEALQSVDGDTLET